MATVNDNGNVGPDTQRIMTCLDDAIADPQCVPIRPIAVAMRSYVANCHVPMRAVQTQNHHRLEAIEQALFSGDPDSGTPGLVPLARRVSIWLDGVCKLWRLAIGIATGLAAIVGAAKVLGMF